MAISFPTLLLAAIAFQIFPLVSTLPSPQVPGLQALDTGAKGVISSAAASTRSLGTTPRHFPAFPSPRANPIPSVNRLIGVSSRARQGSVSTRAASSIFEVNGNLFDEHPVIIRTAMKPGVAGTALEKEYISAKKHLIDAYSFWIQSGEIVRISIQDVAEQKMTLARLERLMEKQAKDKAAAALQKARADAGLSNQGGFKLPNPLSILQRPTKPVTPSDIKKQQQVIATQERVLESAIDTKEKASRILETANHVFVQHGVFVDPPPMNEKELEQAVAHLQKSWNKAEQPDML